MLETANSTYDGDRILSAGGSSVIYDGIGNPTSYRGNALTWNRRSLLSYGNNTFVYNSDGIRVKKTVNGVEHNYILNDTQIMAEVIGGTKTLYYFYDQNGVPTAFRLDENGTQTWYAYETNVQGDVIGIRTTDGTQVVSYTYDAWGRCTVSGSQPALGALNPLRYRGYYYDAETELYYLNSRYYDPDTGRFLNADGYINANGDLLGYNMYVYCSNNPVMFADPSGRFFEFLVITLAAVSCVTLTNHIINAVNYSKIDKELQESYTVLEAVIAIDSILDKYSKEGEKVQVSFESDRVVIYNSYNVTSRYDRQKVSEIIRRTGKTEREYDNLSAEWFGHNVCYSFHIKRESTRTVDIEYKQDGRRYVRIGSKSLEMLGWD